MLLAAHRPYPVALLEFPVEEAGKGDNAAVRVVVGVEDQGPRLVVFGLGRGDTVHDGVEHAGHVLAGLGGDLDDLLFVDAEELHELFRHGLYVRDGEVYLVEDGDDLEVVLHGEVEVGEGLGLDALARVDDEQRPLAGGDGARDLVGEVDVAGGVYEVQVPRAVVPLVEDADGLGLDRNPPLAFQVHGVQDLVHPLALGNGLGYVEEPVGEGAFSVVYVRDYAEVASSFDVVHPASLP